MWRSSSAAEKSKRDKPTQCGTYLTHLWILLMPHLPKHSPLLHSPLQPPPRRVSSSTGLVHTSPGHWRIFPQTNRITTLGPSMDPLTALPSAAPCRQSWVEQASAGTLALRAVGFGQLCIVTLTRTRHTQSQGMKQESPTPHQSGSQQGPKSNQPTRDC